MLSLSAINCYADTQVVSILLDKILYLIRMVVYAIRREREAV